MFLSQKEGGGMVMVQHELITIFLEVKICDIIGCRILVIGVYSKDTNALKYKKMKPPCCILGTFFYFIYLQTEWRGGCELGGGRFLGV